MIFEIKQTHSGVEGNEGADKPAVMEDIATLTPGKLVQTGAKLQVMTQKTIHRGIRERKTKLERRGTSKNLEAIRDATDRDQV